MLGPYTQYTCFCIGKFGLLWSRPSNFFPEQRTRTLFLSVFGNKLVLVKEDGFNYQLQAIVRIGKTFSTSWMASLTALVSRNSNTNTSAALWLKEIKIRIFNFFWKRVPYFLSNFFFFVLFCSFLKLLLFKAPQCCQARTRVKIVQWSSMFNKKNRDGKFSW